MPGVVTRVAREDVIFPAVWGPVRDIADRGTRPETPIQISGNLLPGCDGVTAAGISGVTCHHGNPGLTLLDTVKPGAIARTN